MVLAVGLSDDPRWTEIVTTLSDFWDNQQRVRTLGWRAPDGAGTTVTVRFLASMATEHVQLHVQHDGAGGGGADYNASTFVSSTRISCRTARQQDQTIARNGTDYYVIWLIPVWEETDGTFTKFDGIDEADQMAFVDLGI